MVIMWLIIVAGAVLVAVLAIYARGRHPTPPPRPPRHLDEEHEKLHTDEEET